MPSLSELWDESKYSEGDPVRQLITASKAVKDWPMDTLNWGNELIDVASSGLNKIFPRIPKTHLAKELPQAIYGNKYDTPSLSEYPAEDIENGRTLGRLLNPALLFAGNQKIPMGKEKAFDSARRAVLVGKPSVAEELPNMVEQLKNVPMTRRDFNKGLVTGAGAVAAAPLLSKFATKAEKVPEIVKAAEVIPEASKTYKYNTLQDYITDVSSRIEANAYDLAYEHAMENGYNNMSGMDKFMDDFIDKFNYNNAMKTELEGDALRYTTERQRQKASTMSDEDYLNYLKLGRHDDKVDILTAFSPRAKEEMKALKKLRGNDWKKDLITEYERMY